MTWKPLLIWRVESNWRLENQEGVVSGANGKDGKGWYDDDHSRVYEITCLGYSQCNPT